jgi:hypothetical protein
VIKKLYWIHLPEHIDPYSEGYVGISSDPEKRIKQHKKGTENRYLKHVFNKYGTTIVIDILDEGLEENVLLKEEEYRPNKNIGWNIAKGGGLPPNQKGVKGRKKTFEEIEKMRERARGPKPYLIGKTGPKKRSKPRIKTHTHKLKGDDRTENQKKSSKNHSIKMKNRIPHNRKQVEIFQTLFASTKEAREFFNLSISQYYYLINSTIKFNTPEELKTHIWKERNNKISNTKKNKQDVV